MSPSQRLLRAREFNHRMNSDPSFLQRELHEILDGIGILSLSQALEAQTLWGNYADKYAGVCIEFDANKGLFAAAQQVIYEEALPTVVRLLDSNDDLLRKSALTKHNDWAPEREWRVIARARDAERQARSVQQHSYSSDINAFVLSQHGPGYYQIPSDSLRAVILGPQIQAEDRCWMEHLTEQLCLDHLLVDTKMSNGIVVKKRTAQLDQA